VLLHRIPIRLRLTLASAAAAGVVLTLAGVYVYDRFQSQLDTSIDQTLRLRAADVANLAEQADSAMAEAETVAVGTGPPLAQLLTPTGSVIDATRGARSLKLVSPATLRRARASTTFVERLQSAHGDVRVLATPVGVRGRRVIIVVAAALGDRDHALSALRTELLLALPGALLLITAGGYLLSGAALHPVRDLTAAAESISRTGEDAWLPHPATRDEIADLAATLNQMLQRLHDAARREQRFVADASHELRTPLALLKTELEIALRGPRRIQIYQQALRDAAETTDGLAQLADDLLLLAQSDERGLTLHRRRIDPSELATTVARRFAGRADAAGRAISTDTTRNGAMLVDSVRVTQALTNLVENALRHGSGRITIRVRSDPAATEVAVTDQGPGPPSTFLPRAFERFTRADEARARGGSGLGLAIVDVIARAHGGASFAAATPAGFEAGMRIPAEPGVA
jgi:two-component system, OmpR family, sensor kinase